MCAWVFVCIHVCGGDCEGQRWIVYTGKVVTELWATMYMLGTVPGSSGRPESAINL